MTKAKYKDWLTEDGLLRLSGWARRGLTDAQIAHNCGVSASTLREWKKKHPAISAALKGNKEVVDLQVENALLKRALGYTYEEVTHERRCISGDEAHEKVYAMVETKRVLKEVQPDTTAQIFWLKNRNRADWRDNQDRAEVDRERLELDKRVAEAQIAKLEREAQGDAVQSVVVTFGEDVEGTWAQ